MLALSTSSTSTHAHARPKTRVGVFAQRRAPRVRARAAASRQTRWGNSAEVRRRTSGLSQYLSPEPLLQDPVLVKWRAQQGRSLPTYAYANNNPVRNVDPDGRLDMVVDGVPVHYPNELWPLIPVLLPPLLCQASASCRAAMEPPRNWPERCRETPNTNPNQNRCLLQCEEDHLNALNACEAANASPGYRAVCREMANVVKAFCDYRCMR